MAYEKLNLEDGDVLTAEHMSHIEDGISVLDTTMGDVETALDEIIAIQNGLIGGDSA